MTVEQILGVLLGPNSRWYLARVDHGQVVLKLQHRL